MEQFVRRKNIERFQALLDKVTDARFRDQIKRLIAEEEARENSVAESIVSAQARQRHQN